MKICRIYFNTIHVMSGMNSICKFQDIWKIFTGVRAWIDRQTNSMKNNFQLCWKMFMHSVCLSVHVTEHALTLVNILQMSWNLHMLFIFDIEWTVLKKVCMGLTVRHRDIQRDLGFVYRGISAWPEREVKETKYIIFCRTIFFSISARTA